MRHLSNISLTEKLIWLHSELKNVKRENKKKNCYLKRPKKLSIASLGLIYGEFEEISEK